MRQGSRVVAVVAAISVALPNGPSPLAAPNEGGLFSPECVMEELRPKILASNFDTVEVGTDPLRVKLAIGSASTFSQVVQSMGPNRDFYLVMHDLRDAASGKLYLVYFGVPDGEQPSERYYAGSFTFFDLDIPIFSIDVTGIVLRDLHSQHRNGQTSVIIVPRMLNRSNNLRQNESARATIRRIELVAQCR